MVKMSPLSDFDRKAEAFKSLGLIGLACLSGNGTKTGSAANGMRCGVCGMMAERTVKAYSIVMIFMFVGIKETWAAEDVGMDFSGSQTIFCECG